MWILKWLGGTILVLLIIYFAIQNTEATVVVKFYKWQSVDLPLWVVMYLSFAAGILTWLIVSIVRIVKLKGDMRKLKKNNKRLQDELNRLRNVAIEEESGGDENKLSSIPYQDLDNPLDEGTKDTEPSL